MIESREVEIARLNIGRKGRDQQVDELSFSDSCRKREREQLTVESEDPERDIADSRRQADVENGEGQRSTEVQGGQSGLKSS